MNEKTNLLTERQPEPITIEIWSHADLAAFRLLISEGLWALDRHDDSIRDVIYELVEDSAVKDYDLVGEAIYTFLARMHEFIGGLDEQPTTFESTS